MAHSENENITQIRQGGFYWSSEGKYVYVVLPDGKVTKREVVLGRANLKYYEVVSGLLPGEVVITS